MHTPNSAPRHERTRLQRISDFGRNVIMLLERAAPNQGEAGLRAQGLAQARQDKIIADNHRANP